jgi:hypothetical protein
MLHESASFFQMYQSWRCDMFFDVTGQSMWWFGVVILSLVKLQIQIDRDEVPEQ